MTFRDQMQKHLITVMCWCGLLTVLGGCASLDDHLMLPGNRVGPYVLNTDVTLTKAEEETLRAAGLQFLIGYERSNDLALVIVSSPAYRTRPGGCRVGDSADSVRRIFGVPVQENMGDGMKIEKSPALVYRGISFALTSNKVDSICIGTNSDEEEDANNPAHATGKPAPDR